MKKFSSIKKGNSPHSFSVRRRAAMVLGGSLLCLVAALLLPRVFGVVGATLLYPFHMVSVYVRESPDFLPAYIRSREALAAEYEALQKQLDGLITADLTIRRLEEENGALRTFLGETSTPRLLTRVIARPPFLAYDVLQIDKGTSDGVVVGAPVYVGRDVVVGSVVEAAAHYAFVRLLSSPNFLSTVYLPAAQVAATMEGVGGGVARVRVAQGVRVTPGDLVIMVAYEAGVYGTVTHTESVPQEPEQYAYVQLPEGLQSVRFLTVGALPTSPQTPAALASSTHRAVEAYFYNPDVVPLLSAEAASSTEEEVSTSTPTQ